MQPSKKAQGNDTGRNKAEQKEEKRVKKVMRFENPEIIQVDGREREEQQR